MGRINQLTTEPSSKGRIQQLRESGALVPSTSVDRPTRKKEGLFRDALRGTQDIQTNTGTIEISAKDVIRGIPKATAKVAGGFVDTFVPAIKNFFVKTGSIFGEGLAYAVDPNVRKQYKAGNLELLPTITETSLPDIAKSTIAAGIETAVYKSFPKMVQMKLLPGGGAGALQGLGFAVSTGLAEDKSAEEIVKDLPSYGVSGGVIGVVSPYILPLLKAEIKQLPKEIKGVFKGLRTEIAETLPRRGGRIAQEALQEAVPAAPIAGDVVQEAKPPRISPDIEQARNAVAEGKTLEEFLKAQPKLFHGTRQPLREGKGLFSLTKDRSIAENYSQAIGGRRTGVKNIPELEGAYLYDDFWKFNKDKNIFEFNGKTKTRREMQELANRLEVSPKFKGARVDEYFVDPNVKVLDLTNKSGIEEILSLSTKGNKGAEKILSNTRLNNAFDWGATKSPEQLKAFNEVLLPQLEAKGFGGINYFDDIGKTTAVFDTKFLKTKSQLTDIWNKAVKETPITQAPRAVGEVPVEGAEALAEQKLLEGAFPEQKTLPGTRVSKVTREGLPIGEGRTKVSRLEARMKGVLDDVSPQKAEAEGISTFQQMNKSEQIQKAVAYVERNADEALAVLRGEKSAPEGLLHNSIALALEQKATLGSDANLAVKLASLRSTRAGQEISILTEADRVNPVSHINEIIKARTGKVLRQLKGGETVKTATAKVEKSISSEINRTRLKIAEAENILSEIIC